MAPPKHLFGNPISLQLKEHFYTHVYIASKNVVHTWRFHAIETLEQPWTMTPLPGPSLSFLFRPLLFLPSNFWTQPTQQWISSIAYLCTYKGVYHTNQIFIHFLLLLFFFYFLFSLKTINAIQGSGRGVQAI